MLGTPTQCPSCSAEVSPFDASCPACKQVLGPDNTCEACGALAPVVQRAGRHLCSACEEPRARRPHTVVVYDRQLRFRRGWERFQRKLFALIAVMVFLISGSFGAVTAQFDNTFAQAVAAISALIAVLVPALVIYWSKRVRARSEAHQRFTLEQRLLGLAHQRGGVLTAADTAKQLNIPLKAADDMLDRMVHQQKAELEVTERGEITFVFAPPKQQSALPSSSRPSSSVAARARRGTETL